jgi:ketosteroid isomerase-like protein
MASGANVAASDEVEAALAHFVQVFNALDWDRFEACFAEDATVYAPFPDDPSIAIGRAEFARRWRPRFEARFGGRPGPPYLNIDPKGTRLQFLGADACLVSFRLEDLMGSPRLHRRSLVFEKRGGRWLIVHLHASVASDAM